jgi:predicted transcriptional regulator
VADSSKEPDIGHLEAEVLRELKRLDSASAGEIVEGLKPSRTLAYTTVSTTLDRLHKKGLVSRRSVSGRTGHKYVYSFARDSDRQRQVVNKMVDKLVSAFGPSVVSNIYDRLTELSPEEAAKFKDTLDSKKKLARRSGGGRPDP